MGLALAAWRASSVVAHEAASRAPGTGIEAPGSHPDHDATAEVRQEAHRDHA